MDEVRQYESAAAARAVVACWSCRGPIGPSALFCATCRAVQPPGALDHFARLGFPPAFAVDEAEIDRHYFAAQRLLHPDRFATRTARERAISQSQAVSLNEAYETLKDPLMRANYLLKLKGIDVNPDGCNTIRDPTLLMEQMEQREALQAAETAEDVARLARGAKDQLEACLKRVAAAFVADDLAVAESETTRLKYLVKLVEEARLRRAKLIRVND
ncbi:MAG: Fe-S protein assembly co-chaperone HscB [Proteobacteria bacterium]|nr:Fe-S protein assembly co-chaperone HscB [Pseudomonadota bacterium]